MFENLSPWVYLVAVIGLFIIIGAVLYFSTDVFKGSTDNTTTNTAGARGSKTRTNTGIGPGTGTDNSGTMDSGTETTDLGTMDSGTGTTDSGTSMKPILHWVDDWSNCDGIPSNNIITYATYDGFDIGPSLVTWGCQNYNTEMQVVVIGQEVPNANTLNDTPQNVSSGGVYVVENPNNLPLPESEVVNENSGSGTEDINNTNQYLTLGEMKFNTFTDGGGGNAIYLDRQNVNCGANSGIQDFDLDHVGGDLQYYYQCSKGGVFNGSPIDKSTANHDKGGGDVIYLDRLDVKCDNNQILSQFKLKNAGDDGQRYDYKCQSIQNLTCRNDYSAPTSKSTSNVSLKNQVVHCLDDEALSQFRLQNDGDRLSYAYKCCTDKNFGNQFHLGDGKVTNWNDDGNGKNIYLDRHNIDCGEEPINQIKLETKGGEVRYKFTCERGGNLGDHPEKEHTNENDGRNKNEAIYLDRHNVACPDDSVLTRYHLKPGSGGNMKMLYRCRKVNDPMECQEYATQGNNTGNTRYLNRHNVQCPPDRALQKIRLDTSGNQMHYRYTCCKIK